MFERNIATFEGYLESESFAVLWISNSRSWQWIFYSGIELRASLGAKLLIRQIGVRNRPQPQKKDNPA